MLERHELLRHLHASPTDLTVVSAPPGFGKTVLVRQWLRSTPHVWHTADCDAFSNGRLYSDLSLLLAERCTHEHPPLASSTTNSPQKNLEGELRLRLAQHDTAVPIVIDDFSFSSSFELFDRFLIHFERHKVRLILISRDIPTPLSRRLLYGYATHLNARDLALSHSEVRQLLKHFPPAAISNILRVSFGWPAICGFAANLTPQQALDLGKGRAPELIRNYLEEEVLSRLSPAATSAAQLLLLYSPLEPSTLASLIDITTVAELRSELLSSGAAIQNGEGELLLHPVIHTCAAPQAPTDAARTRRLCRHLEGKGLWSAAVNVSVQCKRPDILSDVMRRALRPLLDSGDVAALRRWQSAASSEDSTQSLRLLVAAEIARRAANFSTAESLASQAAKSLDTRELVSQALTLAGAAAHLSHRDLEATRHYRAALEAEPVGRTRRELLWGYLIAACALESSNAQTVRELLEQSLDPDDPTSELRSAAADFILGRSIGTFRDALPRAEAAQALVEYCDDPMLKSVFLHALSYMRATNAEYRTSLTAAASALAHSARFRLSFVPSHIIPTQALCQLGLRNYGEATALLDQATSIAVDERSKAFFESNVRIVRTRLHLSQGYVEHAVAASSPTGLDVPERTLQAELHAAHALALLLSGSQTHAQRHFEHARMMSNGIESRSLLIVYAIAASLERKSQDYLAHVRSYCDELRMRGAADCLVLAYRAVPELMECADADPAIQSTLAQVASRASDIDACTRLGANSPHAPAARSHHSLTRRETEVASLLVEGLTNMEIADRLVLSHGTVKVHLRSIHRKLGTKTRAQAVLKLLRE